MENHDSGPIRRVLVVEDDPVCRRYTSEALRQKGSAVKQARCLRQALRLALAWRPELILTDLHLPDGCGLDLVRRVRAEWPATHPPPRFVAMTAAAAGRDDALAEFFVMVLRKPFGPSELAALFTPAGNRSPGNQETTAPPRANRCLQRLACREFRGHLPRIATLLETGRLDAAAALAHRLAASAAMCGAAELGQRLQAFSDACVNRPLTTELAETFTAARRLARDFAEGVVPGSESG